VQPKISKLAVRCLNFGRLLGFSLVMKQIAPMLTGLNDRLCHWKTKGSPEDPLT
jgi:hypothetical protein